MQLLQKASQTAVLRNINAYLVKSEETFPSILVKTLIIYKLTNTQIPTCTNVHQIK